MLQTRLTKQAACMCLALQAKTAPMKVQLKHKLKAQKKRVQQVLAIQQARRRKRVKKRINQRVVITLTSLHFYANKQTNKKRYFAGKLSEYCKARVYMLLSAV